MTYLELVNAVLRRLRENQVGTVDQTTYSRMVGAFVNDAKRYIEGTWDWSANRSIVTVSTVASTALYSLTGVGQDPEVHRVWDSTSQRNLGRMSAGAFLDKTYTETVPEGVPSAWAWDVPDASDDQQISVFPTPDGVYDLKFWVSSFQPTLTGDNDILNIPSNPVVLRTVAMLAEEKGETGGYTSARYFEMADKALSDAIAYDAGKYPEEVNWYAI